MVMHGNSKATKSHFVVLMGKKRRLLNPIAKLNVIKVTIHDDNMIQYI